MAENPGFTVFGVGFIAFSGSLAMYSVQVSGIVSGAILMSVAAYPYLRAPRVPRND